MKNIIGRLEALERTHPGEMFLLCEENGEEVTYTIKEFKKHPDAHWKKVIRGGSLADVDYLLKGINALAHDMAKGGSYGKARHIKEA